MTKPARAKPWFASRLAAFRTKGGDPADMGTAFGLELSLLEAAAAPVPRADRAAGWIRRLAARAKAVD